MLLGRVRVCGASLIRRRRGRSFSRLVRMDNTVDRLLRLFCFQSRARTKLNSKVIVRIASITKLRRECAGTACGNASVGIKMIGDEMKGSNFFPLVLKKKQKKTLPTEFVLMSIYSNLKLELSVSSTRISATFS